ncbi:AraC family transcriptional regulator [Cereibacter azotoformans]|uniref:AraC family transcriptional regulator n=1 Tax=Cereibacter azotoformans TaxID=43057 RepID=UPI000C6D7170|nr:AraC family transcriptional regulator [Cereibacter azotoformans]
MNKTAVEIRNYSGEIECHRHDYHQVILPCAGALEIEMERHAGRVGGSIASFVPAGCNHTFLASRADAFIVLDVPTGTGAEVMDNRAIPPFFAIGPDVQGLIDFMMALGPHARLSPSLGEAWTKLLLDRLTGSSAQPDRAELAVRRAVAFMKSRLADPIRVDDIAEAAGVSPSRLHDAFVKRRATTPHAQLVALRLNAAERMLADPRLSIAEIAIRSGHADQSALTRSMRRERGVTPAAVRRGLLGLARGTD